MSTLLGRGIRVIALRHTAATDDTTNWRALSRCRDVDPELFFPIGKGVLAERQTYAAKQVCARCPVIDDCRREAFEEPIAEFGVFGGLDEYERRALRPKRDTEVVCVVCEDVFRPRRSTQALCFSCEKTARGDTRTQLDTFLTEHGEQLRAANAEGVSDIVFAGQVGTSKYLVGRARKHLGLPAAVKPTGR